MMKIVIKEDIEEYLDGSYNDSDILTTVLTNCAYHLDKLRKDTRWFKGWSGETGIMYGRAPKVWERLFELRAFVQDNKEFVIKQAYHFRGADDNTGIKTPETTYEHVKEYLDDAMEALSEHKTNNDKIVMFTR